MKTEEKAILDTLPYLGLDIEDQVEDLVSVEYSPNRPDFSSEAGIARSLVGLLGIQTGPPKYLFAQSKFKVAVVGEEIRRARPLVRAIYAEMPVTDEIIKQLITMQEDLHNGLGRKRSKVAIGIHNAEMIADRINYYATNDQDFSFAPLGSEVKQKISQILAGTEQGQLYGNLLSGSYPILEDSHGNVLSMPPIINGELTRLKSGISKLFVDVTGTDEKAVDVSNAIIASMLSDTGARVFSVEINAAADRIWSPDMTPKTMRFDLALTNDILGVGFTHDEARKALEKSRIGLFSNEEAAIPRYRNDIIHPIDLIEEVALGYGIQKMQPQTLKTSLSGGLDPRLKKIDRIIEVLVGLGLTEIWNLSLGSLDQAGRPDSSGLLRVDDSKSQSFEYLRSNLITSLLHVLGESKHQIYPQNIFEQAQVFRRSSETVSGILEEEHVAVCLADSEANYSRIRSLVDAFLRLVVGDDTSVSLRAYQDGQPTEIFASGRSAGIFFTKDSTSETLVGIVGEVSPETLVRYDLKMPVAAFELNLEPLLKE